MLNTHLVMAPSARIGFALVLAASLHGATSQQPQNFTTLECAVSQFALNYSASKLPPAARPALAEALNVAHLCNSTPGSFISSLHQSQLELETSAHTAARDALLERLTQPGAVATFYVATTGSDVGSGSIDSPFATLKRAATAARAVPNRNPGDVTVFLRAGKYYLGSEGALQLSATDSNVAWAAYQGETVTLSGGVDLGSLQWKNASSPILPPGTLVAHVGTAPEDTRMAAWRRDDTNSDTGRAGPPPLVSSLFINGIRQVRARYPNGNHQDGTGICFSTTQRPGEGCASHSACATGATGMQPAPAGIKVSGIGPDRGKSPTHGCSQRDTNSQFQYTIYPSPPSPCITSRYRALVGAIIVCSASGRPRLTAPRVSL